MKVYILVEKDNWQTKSDDPTFDILYVFDTREMAVAELKYRKDKFKKLNANEIKEAIDDDSFIETKEEAYYQAFDANMAYIYELSIIEKDVHN